jgi:hypothetical protein
MIAAVSFVPSATSSIEARLAPGIDFMDVIGCGAVVASLNVVAS